MKTEHLQPLEIAEVPETHLGTLRTYQRKDETSVTCSCILTWWKFKKRWEEFYGTTLDTGQEYLNHNLSVDNIIYPLPLLHSKHKQKYSKLPISRVQPRMSLTAGHSSSISISKIVSTSASKHRGRPREGPYDHGGFKGKQAVDSSSVISVLSPLL